MKENILKPVTIQTAPVESRPTLGKIQTKFGFVPNLAATLANSPTVLHGYLAMDAVWEKGTFNPVERNLVLLAAVSSIIADTVLPHTARPSKVS
jgi:hypothetical protein